ncbi:MAG TPA: ATP-dependent sacrificial sulfur transferase LarE [Limnochordia bacterium]
MAVQEKIERLQAILRELESVVVAFSGGVDSTFLLKMACDTLGAEKVLAVTADSETYPTRERDEAIRLARLIGAPHRIIHTRELEIPGYAENTPNRCYFCKNELFSQLIPIAREEGYRHVVFGAILDDLGDHRPGLLAARRLGVRAPLQEAQLSKAEIRALSKAQGLPTWDKPSFACLSSRFPYGERITIEKLSMVDKAEAFLLELGFRQVRVRQHGNIARIEVPKEALAQMVERADEIVSFLKGVGYAYVTLDLAGYRSGSMNEVLPERVRERHIS